ncbi:MAG: ATP-binding cassette domain-containing protein [Porphyromonadaceae bacterium]|nr:MAG: ATP-binding cassette domain-containing protein [Porphyromonadaceae bacterium]
MKNENQPGIKEEIVISIRGLYKSFGESQVLKGIDLDVFKGENFVVLGRSGSGKSVLIKIIAGLLKPDQGIVNVIGLKVDKLNQKELQGLRLKMGFIFQSSALYDSMTIRENLEFSMIRNFKHLSSTEINTAVEEVLDAVGLKEKINQMPSDLSGGQIKRIGIARTLILRPEIMLYDEPTAGLDPITCTEINELINEVQSRYNTSSIIITHDLTCAKETGHRIAMLQDGNFFRLGTFEEVFDTDDIRMKSFFDYNFIR